MSDYPNDVDLNIEEPPDLPPMDYTDADVPDEELDFGAPPDFMPVAFVPPEPPNVDEPPVNFLPPAYLMDMPEPVLEALRESGWQEELELEPVQMSFLDEPLTPAPDPAQADVALDSRAALEADLADVLRQLEQVEANENPMEREAQQEALLDQQAALEAELQNLEEEPRPDQEIAPVAAEPEPQVSASAELSDEAMSDIGQGEVNQPFEPFRVEDIEAAMAEREAGIVTPTAPDSLDTVVERMPEEERAALDAREAEDQTRIEAKIEQAEQAVEIPEAVQQETLWNNYINAVLTGQNPGGSEAALVQRAEEMNLVDARFVGYSDPAGHHVSAVELAVDPATGEQYGQSLDVATFQERDQAAALYETLQGHLADNSLPNYAVADYASFAALALGNELEWQQATEQQLVLAAEGIATVPADEPPVPMMDSLIEDYAGIDLSAYPLESTFEYDPEPGDPGLENRLDDPDLDWGIPASQEPPLSLEEELAYYREAQLMPADELPDGLVDQMIQEYASVDLSAYPQESAFDFQFEPTDGPQYAVYLEADPGGKAYLGLGKEWDGGPRGGGDEAYRLVSVYENVQMARDVAQDLANMRHDVERLTSDPVAGAQAMASMAYEIGVASDMIQPGDPLFADQPLDAPLDPFEVQPTEALFAQYAALEPDIEETEPEQPHSQGPDLDF